MTKFFAVITIAALACGLVWLIAKRRASPVPLADAPRLTTYTATRNLAASGTTSRSSQPRASEQNPTVAKPGANTSTQDISRFTVSVGNNANILLTDSAGRRSGLDPAIYQPLEEIPHSVYFQDALVDDLTGGATGEVTRSVNVSQPTEGTYQITLIGAQTGEYELSVRAFSADGTAQPPILLSGNIAQRSNIRFNFNFKTSPGSASSIKQLPE